MGRVVALALLALLVALLIALITALVGVSSRHGTATGPVLATLTLGPVVAGVALDTRAGRAVVGSDFAGRAYVVDTRAGTLLRTIAVAPATTVNRPMVSPGTAIVMDEQDGRAFVGSPSYGPPPHGLSIIDTGSGLLLATIPYRSIVGPWFAADPRSHRLFTLDGPGRVEQVRVYDTRDGHLVRVVPLDMPPSLSSGMSWGGDTVPVAVDTRNGRVFVGRQTSNGVSTVDEARGRLLRTTTIAPLLAAANSINVTSPIVDEHDDRVFVASGDGGTVSTLDARSGRVLRSVRVGQYASNPVIDSVTRRVFVAAGGGLVVLDARSGRLLSRSSQPADWGQSPVVDGRSGNVLIIDELRRTVGVYDGARGRLCVPGTRAADRGASRWMGRLGASTSSIIAAASTRSGGRTRARRCCACSTSAPGARCAPSPLAPASLIVSTSTPGPGAPSFWSTAVPCNSPTPGAGCPRGRAAWRRSRRGRRPRG